MSAPAPRLVLTLNAGSSSLKWALFSADGKARVAGGNVRPIGSREVPDHAAALETALAALAPHGGLEAVAAVGHRVVFGGPRHVGPERVTPDLVEELKGFRKLDPDHLPAEIAIAEAVSARAPDLPQVACFDTAFHRAMPRVARLLPIPRAYLDAGVERFGFHGLSYTYLLEALERLAGREAARGRLVLAHLGSGASLAAVVDGRCVDTTMGFTPTGGVMMGTRTGDLDPGVVVHLLRNERMDAETLNDLVNKRSGLLGVSGTTGDMAELLSREASDPNAAEAVALFCRTVTKAVGALAAVLGGVDTLVFTGGIGEHAAPVRARIAEGLSHLGIHIDAKRNEAAAPVVSPDGGACTVRVIPTDEESVLARQTLATISEGSAS